MSGPKPNLPFFESWLRRTGRQLAVSGCLTQIAMVLASEEDGTVDEWRTRLRTLLEGGELPSLELLTRIDALLASPSKSGTADDFQEQLF